MPTTDPNPGSPSPDLLLAALDRAERHSRTPDQPGVPKSLIAAHLGLPHTSWTTRRVRPALESLEADGLIEQLRRHGVMLWTPTSKGRRRLSASQRVGRVALPESPQHRAWREAYAAAEGRIAEFHAGLRDELAEATALLDGGAKTDSDGWYALGTAIKRGCERLGSATYCLYEWPEPDDDAADGAPPHVAPRRNIRLWEVLRTDT